MLAAVEPDSDQLLIQQAGRLNGIISAGKLELFSSHEFSRIVLFFCFFSIIATRLALASIYRRLSSIVSSLRVVSPRPVSPVSGMSQKDVNGKAFWSW